MKSRRRSSHGLVIVVFGVALAVTAPRAVFADAAKGEQVYKSHQCSMCHKVNGSGGKKGPDLSSAGTQRDAEWLTKYLVNPKSMLPKGTMPPAKVTPAELKDLVDYLETLKGAK